MQGRQLQRPIKDTLTSEWALSRKHPPTLKSSSRANFHKVWHSHQTLLFTHSHFARSHFARSHFTHSHFTRSHEKIEETLFCDMWLPFHSPPPSGCLMRLFPFSRAVDYITAPPRTTECTKQDWEIYKYSDIREYNHTFDQYGDNLNFHRFWYLGKNGI